MDFREQLEAFWSGERPDQIPYTIYRAEAGNNLEHPAMRAMYQAGLRVTYHVPTIQVETKDVEYSRASYEENGQIVERQTMRTPVGEIYTTSVQGWTQEYWIKNATDYRVMTYITQHTNLYECYDAYLQQEKEISDHGVALVALGRTPMQRILVDFVGLENFSYHLFELEDEVMTLYHALLRNFEQAVELVAEGPGRFVSVLENFTAETMGPVRFKEFHLPIYAKCFPVLQRSGKIVGTHYDGKLKSCAEAIASSPIDLIESLTTPPEGDMQLAECREVWPDKLFWSNINVANYDLPPGELKQVVHDMISQGAVGGSRLAFEVSEHVPRNWRQSMPVVLEALRDHR